MASDTLSSEAYNIPYPFVTLLERHLIFFRREAQFRVLPPHCLLWCVKLICLHSTLVATASQSIALDALYVSDRTFETIRIHHLLFVQVAWTVSSSALLFTFCRVSICIAVSTRCPQDLKLQTAHHILNVLEA
jgi:hypothetical protein